MQVMETSNESKLLVKICFLDVFQSYREGAVAALGSVKRVGRLEVAPGASAQLLPFTTFCSVGIYLLLTLSTPLYFIAVLHLVHCTLPGWN